MLDLEDRLLTEVPLVVLDTETTGLHAGLGNRVVELAAIRLENWKPVQKLDLLINPQRNIESGASQISGIHDDDVANAPRFAEIADQFLALAEGAVFVAHNATFDANFIGTELWLAGKCQSADPTQPVLSQPWICTLKLARNNFHFHKNNLAYLAFQLGAKVGQAHRALNDVYMTAEVLRRMSQKLQKEQGLQTVGDYLLAQGQTIYTPPPPDIDLPAILAQAVTHRQAIHITYLNEERTERVISPHYAHSYKGIAYLIGYCHLRQEQRAFRVDRIFSAEPIESPNSISS